MRRGHLMCRTRTLVVCAAGLLSLAAPTDRIAVAAEASGGVQPTADVEIIRDRYGVPHVYASTTRDLFLGYGYAVAEDRLFQMEMAKRSFTGRVAEVLGPSYVAHDTATRQLSSPEIIQRQIDALAPEDRMVLAGYAAGLNRRIGEVLSHENRARLLPKQFVDRGFEPEPWSELDVAMIFVGTMANRFSDAFNELNDLAMLRFLEGKHGKARGDEIFAQMFWPSDPLAPTTTDARAGNPYQPARIASASGFDHLRGRPEPVLARTEGPPLEPVTASNVMVVGGRKAADAKAILLNGPQFSSFNPAYVYAVGLHGAGFDLVGNTPFAYPVVLFGHNGQIAWGATAGASHVVDIYEERLNPVNPMQYLHQGSYRDMERRVEIILAKGEAPVTLEVFRTVHGLVVQRDEGNGVAYAKRRSWEGREVGSLLAWIRSTRARSWDEWRAQAAANALSINWYYADRDGNIGYFSCGLLPDRPENQPAWLPASGTGDMEWRGFLPAERNPQVYNPAQDFLVNWNNRPSPSYTNNDAWLYSRLDRVNVIYDEFNGRDRLNTEDLQAINRRISFADINVDLFLPYLEQAVSLSPADERESRAVEMIRAWQRAGRQRIDQDGDGFYDAAALPIFREWLAAMLRETFADEFDAKSPLLGAIFTTNYPAPSAPPRVQPGSTNVSLGARLLVNALLDQAAPVPQKHDFFNREKPSAVIMHALRSALDDLANAQGPDMARWRDKVVPHEFSTRNFVGVPQAGDDEFLHLPVYMNRGSENNLVVLSADGVRGFDVTPPGQSGFVAPDGTRSPHYDDQLTIFGAFQLKPEAFTRSEVEAGAGSKVTLQGSRP
jgi:penicillin G amidase